ncbi:hypothetical protein AAG906_028006 [Vitis piasezkii]
MSIPPSPPTPKAQEVENIHFHGLGETVTISGDDSTPSVQTPPTALIKSRRVGRSFRALSHIHQHGASSIPYERAHPNIGEDSSGRDCRPSVKLHSSCSTWDLKRDH